MSKAKKLNFEEVEAIVKGMISGVHTWQNEDEGKGAFFFFGETNDRGSRTDHGGGSDGDGHMDWDMIEANAAPFRAKWQPIMDNVKAEMEKLGFEVAFSTMDYGEKGHISVACRVLNQKVKGEDKKPKTTKESKPSGEKKAPKTSATETIDGFKEFPELKVGDTITFTRKKRGGSTEDITGTIQRFFHHIKLDRDECKVKGEDGNRYFAKPGDIITK